MSKVDKLLLSDARAYLAAQVSRTKNLRDVEAALIVWLLGDRVTGLSASALGKRAAERSGAERSYEDVAVLGFLAASGATTSELLGPIETGLSWLSARQPTVAGIPAGFCGDPVAILGVALGARALGKEPASAAVAAWMGAFLRQSCARRGAMEWEKCLYACAHHAVEAASDLAVPAGMDVADVRVALRAKGVLESPAETVVDEDEARTVSLVRQEGLTDLGSVRAAIRLAAFDWVRRARPVVTLLRPTVAEVCNLLKRVPMALRKWTWEERPRTSGRNAEIRKWHVDNEYHVQNLLWATLSPVFPDLADEEYLARLGQYQPRADLCIPSLQLIVEVKFMRAETPPKDIIEQVSADTGIYLTEKSGFSGVLPFVWDDSRRTEQYAMLAEGLCRLKGVVDAIIVARPGSMSA